MQNHSGEFLRRVLSGFGLAITFTAGASAQGRPQQQTGAVKQGKSGWQAAGTLFEACSCIVPCPCNFGQGPMAANGKRDYCHTVYAYRLQTASYGEVKLDGLIFGGGEAAGGAFGFLDSRATPTQKAALEKLALAVFGSGGASGGPRRFASTRITAEDSPGKFRVNFADSGGFSADILIGADGKNPIIVENNATWPVKRFLKGKTTAFDYHDPLSNRLRLDGVNANLGTFALSGTGAEKGKTGAKAGGSCCAFGKKQG